MDIRKFAKCHLIVIWWSLIRLEAIQNNRMTTNDNH